MHKRVILQKSIFNFISFSTSDYFSQVIEQYYSKNKSINKQRILQHGLLGVTMTPFYHLQYSIIGPTLFKPHQYIQRLLFDQIICCPIQNSVFFAVQGVIHGHTFQQTMKRLKTIGVSSTIDGYKIWPLLTGLTFKYIPPRYCEYSFSLFGMLWGVYLSYIGHKKCQ